MLILLNLWVHRWQFQQLHQQQTTQITVHHHPAGEVFHQWLIFHTPKPKWMVYIRQPTETKDTQHLLLVNTRPRGINLTVIKKTKCFQFLYICFTKMSRKRITHCLSFTKGQYYDLNVLKDVRYNMNHNMLQLYSTSVFRKASCSFN